MVDIICLGHILNEKIIFPDKIISPVLGSPVAYSSVCMASLGVNVGIVTKIGNDFPGGLLEVFKKAGVDTSGIILGENSTSNELIYDEKGDKKLRFITRAPDIDINDIPEEYMTAKIFCVNPMDNEVSLDTVKKLLKHSGSIVADLGGYGGGTTEKHPDIKDGHDINEIAPCLEVAKASIEDLRYIFGDYIDERIISQEIIKLGTGSVVITLGEKGSYVRNDKGEKYIPPYPIKRFEDQTGAGDCFFAGFLSNYLRSRNPFEAALYGNAASSYIVERSGGVVIDRMPKSNEVRKRVKLLKSL